MITCAAYSVHMEITPLAIFDVKIITPKLFGDERGYFMEVYHEEKYKAAGIPDTFVQDNQSLSQQGVLRGLHYQLGNAQAKLVRVYTGKIFDVAVDIRKGSPTFGKWVGEILSGENKKTMYIPKGFAHGFFVLSEQAEFMYKCSDFYTPAEERGIRWDDPALGINWPIPTHAAPLLSPRDRELPLLSEMPEADLPVMSH